MKGYLSIILHTHLPYVRHEEDAHALEQRWLFEAITESYIPLLNVLDQLRSEQVRVRLTMSLTPPLIDLLCDPLVQQRYLNHLNRSIELAEKEVVRLANDPSFRRVAEMYLWKLKEAHWVYTEKYHGNIINGFRQLWKAGCLELITSAATHAYLPLLRTREAIDAQIRLGIESFHRILGYRPRGLWLPECGYTAEVDEVIASNGIDYVIVDSHALLHADPAPDTAVYAPVRTQTGTLAFARDPDSAKQVWSSKEGYPGDGVYREYYRDIGWDLDYEYIKPYLHPDGFRLNTGFKYYRITGDSTYKEVYIPEIAQSRVAEHAGHFLHERITQANDLNNSLQRVPIVVSPYDTELFGHWWYEGPAFLYYLLKKMHYDQNELELISPADYPLQPAVENTELPSCSWGNEGYNAVWINDTNAWIYRHLHAAEERMTALAEAKLHPSSQERRALNQAGRELMLAQSSDWSFILNAGTATTYAQRRIQQHLGWFFSLCDQIEKEKIDEPMLTTLERRHSIFSYLDYRAFAGKDDIDNIAAAYSGNMRILILSWEYPPLTVGGLGRHVYELSKALAQKGIKVHVITLGGRGLPQRQIINGVLVHRTPAISMPGDSFLDWVFQLNLQIYELARQIWLRWPCDLVHGHDWLVGEASRMLANRYRVPLLATIHATEQGRNHGLHNETQRNIDARERELISASEKVIVCSQAMRSEMTDVFKLSADQVAVIPNGIDVSTLTPTHGLSSIALPDTGKVVAFLGRFVKEKGVELLIEAAGEICRNRAGIHFVMAGRGPLQDQLKHRTRELGISERVIFPGFVDDRGRNTILARATVSVFPSLYEPFGIVALEAMGAGVPTIVSDTGGLAEIVDHGINGWKVYPGDLWGLIRTLEYVLDNPVEARRVADEGRRKTINVYGWPAIAQSTLEVYNELVQGKATRQLEKALLFPTEKLQAN
jgi:1,4-alpha-glucan branching enzyme